MQEATGKVADGVYTLDPKKAKGNNDLIDGTYYLNNQTWFVLFDFGASHSFILTIRVQRIRLEAIHLPSLMVVTTVIDSSVET